MLWIMGDHAEMKGCTVLGIMNGRTCCSYNINFNAMVIKHAEEISTWGAAYRDWHYQNAVLILGGNVRNNSSDRKPHWKHLRTRARMLKKHRTRTRVYTSSMDSIPQQKIHMTALAVVNIMHDTTTGLKDECYMDHCIYVEKRPDCSKNIKEHHHHLFRIFSWIMPSSSLPTRGIWLSWAGKVRMGNSDHIPESFNMPTNSTVDVKAENPRL